MSYEELSPPSPNNPRAYLERFPQPGMFNVAAMPHEDLVDLGKTLQFGAAQVEQVGFLLERLGADIADLAASDPEHGRQLVDRLAHSVDRSERYIAVVAAPSLSRVDYELARDMLATVRRIDHQQNCEYVRGSSLYASQQPWEVRMYEDLVQRGQHDQARDFVDHGIALGVELWGPPATDKDEH